MSANLRDTECWSSRLTILVTLISLLSCLVICSERSVLGGTDGHP